MMIESVALKIAINIASILTVILICYLHVFSVLLKRKIREVLVFVNLGLHILLTFELMAMQVSFEFLALSFMVSLFVYLFSFFVITKIRMRRGEKNDL